MIRAWMERVMRRTAGHLENLTDDYQYGNKASWEYTLNLQC